MPRAMYVAALAILLTNTVVAQQSSDTAKPQPPATKKFTPEELAQRVADRAEGQRRAAANRAAFKQKVNAWRAEQAAPVQAQQNAIAARQQSLNDTYDHARAAAAGAADGMALAQQQQADYEAQLRYWYPQTVIVAPYCYNPVTDYWGIYSPGLNVRPSR